MLPWAQIKQKEKWTLTTLTLSLVLHCDHASPCSLMLVLFSLRQCCNSTEGFSRRTRLVQVQEKRGSLILTVNLHVEGQSLVFKGWTADDTLDQLVTEFSGWNSNK